MRSPSSSSVSNGRQEVSSLEVEVDEAARLCFYGIKAQIRTSRTEGRGIRTEDFLAARVTQVARHLACNYFEWIDPAPVVYGEDALAGMVRKVKILKDKVKISKDKVKISEDKVNISEGKVKILEEQVQVLQEQLLKQKATERRLKARLLGSWMFFGCVFLLLCS